MEIPDMLRQVDIVDFISQYVVLQQKGDEFWGFSPFKEERTPSFSVRRDSGDGIGKFFDFSSGIGGSCITFIKYYNNCSSAEAVKTLSDYLGIDGSKTFSLRQKLSATTVCRKFSLQPNVKKESNVKPLPSDYMNRYINNPNKLELWRSEGISDEAMNHFCVRYDDFSNCIVYPIKDIDGNIVNVGGRTLEPDFKERGIRKYTYFKPWGGQMSLIYGLFENMEAIRKKGEVILFEGVKSVMLARGYGHDNCGAILTSHLNPGQMRILVKLGVNVVFALDKDVRIKDDHNIVKLKRFVRVEYLYDAHDLLSEKDSPVDKGNDVFEKLYNERLVLK